MGIENFAFEIESEIIFGKNIAKLNQSDVCSYSSHSQLLGVGEGGGFLSPSSPTALYCIT